MDEIEVRVHKEIRDFNERYYGLTFREWVTAIIVVGINVPLYLFGRKYIGDDAMSYIVIFIAFIIGGIGLGKINGLHVEQIYKHIIRQYFYLNKPLVYKTDEMIREEELARNAKKKKRYKKNKR